MGFNFTDRQQTTIATALTLLSATLIMAVSFGGIALLVLFVDYFSGVFMPVAVAGIIALVINPYYSWVNARVPVPVLALILVFLSLLLPLALLVWFFGSILLEQLTGLLAKIPVWLDAAWRVIHTRWPELPRVLNLDPEEIRRQAFTMLQEHGDIITAGIKNIGGRLATAGSGLLHSVSAVLGWVVLPVYLTFFLMERLISTSRLEGQLPFLKEDTRKDVIYLVNQFVDILVAFFRGQVIIALLQGLLFALGFTIAGLQYGLIIGLLLGFLNIIPYLGNIVGLGIALPVGFLQDGGGTGLVLGVGVVFIVVQIIEGYVLTPRIMGQRTGLHPMAIMISIFFWSTAFQGLAGMLLAIPLTAFFVVFWRLLKAKYISAVF